jgi:ribosomal subunit interface protein
MRINVRGKGFDLTGLARAFVASRLLSALGRFAARVDSVVVHLVATKGRTETDAAACDIVVHLHPTGQVRSRTEDRHMRTAIDKAAAEIGKQVERQVLLPQHEAGLTPVVGTRPNDGPPQVALDADRISYGLREMLEPPEDYSRPLRVREHWRPPGGAQDEDVSVLRPSARRPLKSRRHKGSRVT